MPVERTVYPEISIRMSRVLTLLARHHPQREIATLPSRGPLSATKSHVLSTSPGVGINARSHAGGTSTGCLGFAGCSPSWTSMRVTSSHDPGNS